MNLIIDNLDDLETEIAHDDSDADAITAEILKETRHETDEKDEFLNEKLSVLLKNLPREAETKFIVTRLADKNLLGKFRMSCEQNEECDAVYWNGDSDPSELYATVRRLHGGGLYRFRTHANGAFVKNGTWTQVIADPPEPSQKEKILLERNKPAEPVQPFVINQPVSNNNDDSFEKFMLQVQKFEQFKQMIAPPPPAPPPVESQQPNITKESIKMALIEKAMNEPELVSMAIRSVFDISPEVAETAEEKNTIIEVLKYIATHPGESKTVLETILGSLGSIISPIANLGIPKTPPIDINAFRQPRSEPPPPEQTQTQSQPTQTVKIEPIFPLIEL